MFCRSFVDVLFFLARCRSTLKLCAYKHSRQAVDAAHFTAGRASSVTGILFDCDPPTGPEMRSRDKIPRYHRAASVFASGRRVQQLRTAKKSRAFWIPKNERKCRKTKTSCCIQFQRHLDLFGFNYVCPSFSSTVLLYVSVCLNFVAIKLRQLSECW